MEIFKALVEAQSAHKVTADLLGRSFGCSLAVVSDVADPLSIGRIRVMLASKGARTQTDWLFRLTPTKLVSVPLVDIGDTVVVSFINGDPNSGVYLGVLNNKPQPPDKETTYTVSTNGETKITQTPEHISLVTGQSSLKLTSDGKLEISGVTSAMINGQQVATIGAKDTHNDTLITKGW